MRIIAVANLFIFQCPILATMHLLVYGAKTCVFTIVLRYLVIASQSMQAVDITAVIP